MRKLTTLTTALFAAAAFMAATMGTSSAHYWYYHPKAPPKQPNPIEHHSHNYGPWAIGCGLASAGSLMIGTAVHAGDKNDPRQLTITEAAWHSSACPFMLPWALIAQATCPDNKATYEVARLAFRYLKHHVGGDQSAFTNAYGEACRTGKLSRDTVHLLHSLI